MVNNQVIQELNKKMASGIVDGTGYKPSDYPTVASLTRLIVPLKDLEAYVLMTVMLKYPDNPLISPQYNELVNLKNEYRARIRAYQLEKNMSDDEVQKILQNVVSCRSHPYEDFKPYSLSFQGYNDTSVYLGLREYIPDFPASRFDAHWEKMSNGKSVIVVPNSRVRDFLTYVRRAGTVGHIAPEALIMHMEGVEHTQKTERKEPPVFISIYPAGEVNEYGHDAYIMTSKSPALIDALWKQKDIAVKYVDARRFQDKIVVYTTKMLLPALMRFCQENKIEIHTSRYPLDKAPDATEKETPQVIDVDALDLPITPYPFQVEDANKLLDMKRALLGHDMGCGKTIITILVGMHIDEPKIVICPESLRLNWRKEIERMMPEAEVSIVYSKDLCAKVAKDWTIMGYKTAAKFKDHLGKGVFTLVVDEAHNIKSVDNYGHPASTRAKAVMELADKADRLYLLTGTPMPTRSKDLYNLLVMLHAIDGSVPYAFHRYGLQYCRAFQTSFGWNYNGTSNREELHKLLKKYMIRRLKKEVLPNLKKQRQFIPVAETNTEYKAIEKEMMSTEPTLAYLGKAMKGRRLLSKNKIRPAIDLAENYINSEESIVIVTEFRETLDKIAGYFGNNACTICGDMTDKAKQKAIDDFQSGRKKVCVINVVAGGVGVTLTRAHNMIICDYDWTPSNMVQVEDRICRSGQTECCNIYYLYCENALLDKAFISMITHKSENVDKVVDNSENTTDLESAKNSNKMYYEYLVAQIRKEKNKKKTPAKKSNGAEEDPKPTSGKRGRKPASAKNQ